jgi:hypothetical protein
MIASKQSPLSAGKTLEQFGHLNIGIDRMRHIHNKNGYTSHPEKQSR